MIPRTKCSASPVFRPSYIIGQGLGLVVMDGPRVAPNPWVLDGSPLPMGCGPLDSAGVLDRIRFFLRNWPGLVTALLSQEDRHARLIQTIAGYAHTESGAGMGPEVHDCPPTPFDTPLDIHGIKSFELTLSLDSIKSVNSTSSLWTEILEYEYQFGWPDNRVWCDERTTSVLAILFVGLGEDIPEKGKGLLGLSRAAQSLLAEIFSYSNDGLGKGWNGVVKKMRNVSTIRVEENTKFISTNSQFKRIQTWMNEIIPGQNRNPGLSQRYLRGGSSLLVSCLSSVRAKSSSVNYSNILIDGGGRLVQKHRSDYEGPYRAIYRPYIGPIYSLFGIRAYGDSEVGSINDTMDTKIERISPASETLLRENYDPNRIMVGRMDGAYAYNGSRMAVYPITHVGEEDLSIDSILSEMNERIRDSIRIVVSDPCNDSKLRGVSIFNSGREGEERDSVIDSLVEKEVVTSSKEFSPTQNTQISRPGLSTRKIVPWDDSCPRCNASIAIEENEASQIQKGEGGFCYGHRLLHSIGDRQRTRDSALRQPKDSDLSTRYITPPPTQRKVLAIARLDGNSIGWILNPTRLEDEFDGNSDGIKRRSMRFNAHWWSALSKALHEVNQRMPDQVACWVYAGDDIVLAEYSNSEERPGGLALTETIRRFTELVNSGLNRELSSNPDGPIATHCSGLSIRGSGESIVDLLERSSIQEAFAKKMWKLERTGLASGRVMISPDKVEKQSFEIKRMMIDPIVEREGGIPYLDSNNLEAIAVEHSLDLSEKMDLARLRDICLRAEAVDYRGELKILISERKSDVVIENEVEYKEISMDESLVLSD